MAQLHDMACHQQNILTICIVTKGKLQNSIQQIKMVHDKRSANKS